MRRMNTLWRSTAVAALTLLTATACADLEVLNPNDADADRAIANPEDVESLIAGSLNQWHGGFYHWAGPGPFLSSQSFQHSSTPANFSMFFFSGIPRPEVQNDPAGTGYGNFTETWYESYAALAAVRDGLIALEDEEFASVLGPDRVTRARAFGRFVQGMAHATLALLYDQAFIIDETVETTQPETIEPAGYNEVMQTAFGYFNEAISISEGADFEIPGSWIFETPTSSEMLAKVAHSEMARFRAAVARTPAERAAVDWQAVIADIDAGVENGWLVSFDWDLGWRNRVLDYTNFDGWSQLNYFVLGMADTSGNYQQWLALPLAKRHPQMPPDGEPFLIVTPDQRFPQGTSLDEQRQNPGTVWMVPCQVDEGAPDPAPGEPCFNDFGVSNNWARPARGTWRWSYYWSYEFANYNYGLGSTPKEEYHIDPEGMRLLKAEALYRTGDEAAAAALVDMSRTAAGLDPIADGTNDSCVPKLPSGCTNDLFEALKWEKRNEARMIGLFGAPWYFDSRGWGDLYEGTQLQFPVPCQELDILGRLPCYTFGGGEVAFSAEPSNYGWETTE